MFRRVVKENIGRRSEKSRSSVLPDRLKWL
jgi:hypothetical protein